MKSMANRIDKPASAAAPGAAPLRRPAGNPLAAPLQADMGRRFGHDFSQVRVHTDSDAAKSARAMGAQAYTVGNDIAFAAGRFAPSSPAGRHLLAHELAHVVQQHGSAGKVQAKLEASTPGDSSERMADAAADAVLGGQAVPVQPRTGMQLARQESGAAVPSTSRRIEGSAATVSWIDPSSPAGARVPDPAPPAVVTEPFLTGSTGFRFTNYLHAWCETADGVHLTGNGLHANSGMYRGPSYMGISSHPYNLIRSTSPFTEGGIEGVDFDQTAGARTISAGALGGAVGAAVGGGGGAWAGASVGATIGLAGGPIGSLAGGIIGGIVGGVSGYLAGTAVANRIFNFPPIWTHIRLRLKADGTRSTRMLGHSYFPSNNHYLDLSQVAAYSAMASQQTSWENAGWDSGNPWGIARPLVTP